MSTSNTIAAETTRATDLIAGFNKHLATVTSLTLSSVVYTPAQILTALQTIIDLHDAVDTAKSATKAKLGALKAQAPALRVIIRALVAYVKLTFGESPDVLGDFGLPPKKAKTPMTVEQKTVANAKREATRAARGTTSKKAKKSVKGGVIDVVTTPVKAGPPVVTSSATPTAAPAAPSAATGSTTGGTTSHGA